MLGSTVETVVGIVTGCVVGTTIGVTLGSAIGATVGVMLGFTVGTAAVQAQKNKNRLHGYKTLWFHNLLISDIYINSYQA